jgi:hypothetical protein
LVERHADGPPEGRTGDLRSPGWGLRNPYLGSHLRLARGQEPIENKRFWMEPPKFPEWLPDAALLHPTTHFLHRPEKPGMPGTRPPMTAERLL